jgi:D-glycero-D-manno-heptose 1,7-bisphosphate phosphatase
MSHYDRVVFLDRDGVINVSPPAPGWVLRWEEFRFRDGALDALRRLHEHGFTVAVITNQSCVGRGLIALEAVQDINRRMREAVAAAGGRLAGVYVCPHVKEDECPCRKPKPGLIDQAAREHGLDPSRAFLIGDSERDIQAGHARGCTTVLVRPAEEPSGEECRPDYVVAALPEAVDLLLRLVSGGA